MYTGIIAREMNALLQLFLSMTIEKITMKDLYHNLCFFRFKSQAKFLGADKNRQI